MKNKITFGEILIIVILLVILSWITYNQFELAGAKSRDVGRKNSLNELGQAIRLYYADYGVLPKEEFINSLWGKEWKDGDYVYVKLVPQKVIGEKGYCYLVDGDGKNFSLLADLENKADIECQKDKWECGGQSFCYKHTLTAEVVR
jgi:Tfp pilus assembly protein PilE